MISSHFRGKITELQVASIFLEAGYQVCEPLVMDSRYDFILDIGSDLLKIQVKTSTLKENGAFIEFSTNSSHTNSTGTINKGYTVDEIDYFATVFDGECYLVPVEDSGARAQRLRMKPTKNNQVIGIKFAKDYLFHKILAN